MLSAVARTIVFVYSCIHRTVFKKVGGLYAWLIFGVKFQWHTATWDLACTLQHLR